MDLFFKISGIILLFLIFIILIRAIKGPTVIDRLVSINVIGTKSIIILLFVGILFHRLEMFVDIAIGYGLLNYITSIAASKYYQHKKRLHPEYQWKGETRKL